MFFPRRLGEKTPGRFKHPQAGIKQRVQGFDTFMRGDHSTCFLESGRIQGGDRFSLSIVNLLVRPGIGLRCFLGCAYLIIGFHPGSPLQSLPGISSPVVHLSLALLLFLVFEVCDYQWRGAGHLRRATTLYGENGAPEKARHVLQEVIQAGRHAGVSSRACCLLAAIEIEQGRFAEAMALTRQARCFERSRSVKASHLILEGLISHLLGQPREAISQLESARSMHPRKPQQGLIHLIKASVLIFHEQDSLNGLSHLDRSAAAPGHPLVNRQLPLLVALGLAESDMLEEARAVWSQAPEDLALKPYVLGRVLHREKDLKKAVAAYREALEKLDDSFILYRTVCQYHLGKACMELGQVQEGSRFLHQALHSVLPKCYSRKIPHQEESGNDRLEIPSF